jgi:hypothetical protein
MYRLATNNVSPILSVDTSDAFTVKLPAGDIDEKGITGQLHDYALPVGWRG